MIKIIKTDAVHPDFRKLVSRLDEDLASRDGTEHSFYDQYNKLDHIKYAVVAYEQQEPIGCGAIKAWQSKIMEVKRMYVIPEKRGGGIATKILAELESWAKELEYHSCILETGKRQPEAIALYVKNGYVPIPNYGQYAGIENSVCFEKHL